MSSRVISNPSDADFAAVYFVVDAAAIPSVISLDRAHAALANSAAAVNEGRPSDDWYRLLAQFGSDSPLQTESQDHVATPQSLEAETSRYRKIVRLLVSAAAFFANRADALEGRAASLPTALASDSGSCVVVAIEESSRTADVFLAHAREDRWRDLLSLVNAPDIAGSLLRTQETRPASGVVLQAKSSRGLRAARADRHEQDRRLVILVSGRRHELPPTLTERAQEALREWARAVRHGSAPRAEVFAADTGREVAQLPLNVTTGDQRAAEVWVRQAAASVAAVRTGATDLDLLDAIRKAVQGQPVGMLVVIGSGLNPAGEPDLRGVDWDANLEDFVASLSTEGRTPDLREMDVLFIGLGHLAHGMPPLSVRRQAHIADLWWAICDNSGAASWAVSGPDLANLGEELALLQQGAMIERLNSLSRGVRSDPLPRQRIRTDVANRLLHGRRPTAHFTTSFTPDPTPTPKAARAESDHSSTGGPDWDLVRSAQQGDMVAFGDLFDRYYDVVFRYVLFRTGDRTLSEDLTQETFVRALRRISSVSYQGRDIGAWFVTIARNLIFDHVKSSRYRLEQTTSEIVERSPSTEGLLSPSTEQEVLDRATNEELLRCVRKLNPDQQECIQLRFLQGLSVAETAEIMDRHEGAVKALERRAILRLTQILPLSLAGDVDILIRSSDIEALARRADDGDPLAAWELAELLAQNGESDVLQQRAAAGDTGAARRLARLLANRGDVEALSERADAGDADAGRHLAVLRLNSSRHTVENTTDAQQVELFPEGLDGLPDQLVGFRGPTACQVVGITHRQLDYWARTGLVVPSIRGAAGSGSQRLYSFKDVLVLKVVKRLLDAGVTLENIRVGVRHLRRRGIRDLAGITLFSDGTTVYECASPEEVVDLLRGGQGVFGIAVGGAMKEISGSIKDFPVERADGGSVDDAPEGSRDARSRGGVAG